MIRHGTVSSSFCSWIFVSFFSSVLLLLLVIVIVKWQLLFLKRPPREREYAVAKRTQDSSSHSPFYHISSSRFLHNIPNETKIEIVSPWTYFFLFQPSLFSSMFYLMNFSSNWFSGEGFFTVNIFHFFYCFSQWNICLWNISVLQRKDKSTRLVSTKHSSMGKSFVWKERHAMIVKRGNLLVCFLCTFSFAD